MDRPIEAVREKTRIVAATERPYQSGHLMCRATPWGAMGFLACSYFTWISFSHIARNEYDWPHDGWTAATYVVWILVLIGLMLDTRCRREKLFFGVLVANFLIGFGLTVWRTIPPAQVRNARLGTGVLWALAAVISLTTMGRGNRTAQP